MGNAGHVVQKASTNSMAQQVGNHFVLKTPLKGPFPEGHKRCVFATGCFWGAEKGFWRLPGVYTSAVCYVGGKVQDPTYSDVCSGQTGHTEGVFVIYDPKVISFSDLLIQFWMCHNPTQGNRQGHDTGTQYRSGIYYSTDDQGLLAEASRDAYDVELQKEGLPHITTELKQTEEFYYAEDYHQQYLAKPGSRQYCSAAPTAVPVPPLDRWNVSDELKKEHKHLLPAKFWDRFGPKPGCTIKCPNEKIDLNDL